MQPLLEELKRRNVFRAAAFYAAASWLLVQIATQVFPFFDVPNWAVRVVVIAALIGFPFAVLLSWFYEWTPQGLRRESEVAPDESVTRQTGKKLDRWIIAVLSATVVMLLANQFVAHKSQSTAVAGDSNAAKVVASKSIAVLPFENLSADKDNAYFASGMQDEILTRIAGIRDLKVISRTSTEQYASRPPNLTTVAEQLGVATVLEGSVQRAADSVHINVQLIDARSDSHLWAESYDRDLKDIFGVERDVAAKVADALKARLLPAEVARAAAIPTTNAEAYDLYLQAGFHANRGYDQDVLVPDEMPQAIALYEQALAKDPDFAIAEAALARAHMYMYLFGPDRRAARLDAAKAAAERALALQPDLAEGHFALALYSYWGHRDYAQATVQLQQAQRALPNSADIEIVLASIERRQGHWEASVAGFKQATVLDPRSAFAFDQLGFTYQMLRRYADADNAFKDAVDVTADAAAERVAPAQNIVAWRGDLAPLRAALDAIKAKPDAYKANLWVSYALDWWSRDYVAAIALAQSRHVDWSDANNVVLPRLLYLAWAQQAAGDLAQAKANYSEVRQHAQAELGKHPDDAGLHLALGFADAGLGLKEAAEREGQQAVVLVPVSRDATSGPGYLGWLAQIQVRAGDTDRALATLKQLLELPAGAVVSVALLKLNPIWDPLRADPRFRKLLEEHPNDDKVAAHE